MTLRARTIVPLIFAVCAAGCGGGASLGVNHMLPSVETSTDPFGAKKSIVVTATGDSGTGTLRTAVSSAKAGSSITFKLKKGATIKLTNGPIALKKTITITGPGSTALTISGGGRSQIFTVAARVRATISGLKVTLGSSSQGGAIYNSGLLTLRDDAFVQNVVKSPATPSTRPAGRARFDPKPRTHDGRARKHPAAVAGAAPLATATGLGGAIYSAANATLVVDSSSFSSNQGAMGGAVAAAGPASFSDDTFTGNAGYRGSGAPISGGYGYGAALYVQGKTTVAKCSFSNNVVGGAVEASFGAGGAIAQYAGSLSITQSTFTGNRAGGGTQGSWGTGGAIYTTAGTMSLVGNTFTSNSAGGDAYGYGGAVYADQAISGSANVFSKNTAVGSAVDGTAYGGAVYAGGGVTLSGDAFSSNAASGGGAAVAGYSYGGALDSEFGSTLASVSFTGNAASGGLSGSAEGGAVYLGGGTNSWTTLTFSSNSASAAGPSSFATGGAVVAFAPLSIAGTTSLTSNAATVATSGALGGTGGAITVEIGPFSFAGSTGSSVTSNSSTTEGAGLWIDDTSTISNLPIVGNHVLAVQSTNDGGGGIYVALGGVLTLTGSTLSGNATAGSVIATGGGGLFNAGGAAVSNSTFTGNSSAVDGGGIENDSTTGFALTNVTVYQNVATGLGGSIKNLDSDASMTVANSIVAGGTAGTGPDISNDGTVNSGDYNIIQTAVAGAAIGGTTTHNLASDPLLLGLTNNGGPTETNADQAGSPGLAYVPLSACTNLGITTDQRGDPRGPNSDNLCDVGAFEDQAP